MAVAELHRDNTRNAVWLRLDLGLGERFAQQLDHLVEATHQHAGIRNRADSVRVTEAAISVLLANLLRAHHFDQDRYVIVSMSANDYVSGPYNPLGTSYRAIERTMAFLRAGRLAEYRPGGRFRDPRGNVIARQTTRLRATDRLMALLDARGQDVAPDLIKAELPIIRLKNQNGKLVRYEDTRETAEMRRRLQTYNEFLDLQSIDLLVPDNDAQDLFGRAGERDGDGRERGAVDLAFQRRLHRVFNNSTFNHGGRFYGGWWQGIRSELRRFVTINWTPTIELDYSNMQAAMLYALEDFDLEGDAYAIDGIGPIYRPLVKKTFFKLINAEGRMRSAPRADLPAGWTWREFLEAIREKHHRIAQHFNSGIGIQLQRLDSDIAEEVMMHFAERDILVLPVHDSFLVYPGQVAATQEAMVAAYRRVMGRDIAVDVGELFLVADHPDIWELHDLNVRQIDDFIVELENHPAYEGYRRRKGEFLAGKDEAWRWRFYAQ